MLDKANKVEKKNKKNSYGKDKKLYQKKRNKIETSTYLYVRFFYPDLRRPLCRQLIQLCPSQSLFSYHDIKVIYLSNNSRFVEIFDKRKTVRYNTVRYNTVRYNTAQYSTLQYRTVQYSTLQYKYSTIQYCTIQYNTAQYNTIQYSTIQYSTTQYNTIQHNTIQQNTI